MYNYFNVRAIFLPAAFSGAVFLREDISVKESRGQPKSGALKQATCKGNF
jgi:hypothetical protein